MAYIVMAGAPWPVRQGVMAYIVMAGALCAVPQERAALGLRAIHADARRRRLLHGQQGCEHRLICHNQYAITNMP